MRPWKILLVDDYDLYRDPVEKRLRLEKYDVVTAGTADEARSILEGPQPVDLAILDLRLNDEDPQDVSGLELALGPARDIPHIVVTMHDETAMREIFQVLANRGYSRTPDMVMKYGANEGLNRLLSLVREKLVPPVFIAHGHSDVRLTVRERVKRVGLHPVTLAEEPIGGQTVIEQLEKEAGRAHYAVVVITGDDRGGPRDAPVKRLKPRGRENVIFELGFFVAALGRRRVLALVEPGVEILSNFLGVRYIELDSRGEWKDRLEEELQRALL